MANLNKRFFDRFKKKKTEWERAAFYVSMFVVVNCGWKEKNTLLLKGSEVIDYHNNNLQATYVLSDSPKDKV